jgi:hypothetical protein
MPGGCDWLAAVGGIASWSAHQRPCGWSRLTSRVSQGPRLKKRQGGHKLCSDKHFAGGARVVLWPWRSGACRPAGNFPRAKRKAILTSGRVVRGARARGLIEIRWAAPDAGAPRGISCGPHRTTPVVRPRKRACLTTWRQRKRCYLPRTLSTDRRRTCCSATHIGHTVSRRTSLDARAVDRPYSRYLAEKTLRPAAPRPGWHDTAKNGPITEGQRRRYGANTAGAIRIWPRPAKQYLGITSS